VVVIDRSTYDSAVNLPKKCIHKTNANVELSTWTFEDAMAFAEGELAIAA
jgi:hypothetical protein